MIFKKVIGIDISDTSVKIIEALSGHGGAQVLSCNRCALKKGLLVDGEIKDSEALGKTISELLRSAQPKAIKSKDVCLGIPDYQVFSYYESAISEENSKKKGFATDLACRNIPIERNNLLLVSQQYTAANGTGKTVELAMAATSNDLILKWEKFFSSIGLNLVSLVSNTSAASLAMDLPPSSPFCLVDIGDKLANINVFHKGNVIHSTSLTHAGALITKNISQSINNADGKPLSEEEAESLKTAPGQIHEPAIELFINNTLRTVCSNIQSSLELCSSLKNVCADKIYLIGGSAKLANILGICQEYFDSAHISLNCAAETPAKQGQEGKSVIPGNGIKIETFHVYQSHSSLLSKRGLDAAYLSALGTATAYLRKNNISFTKEQIKNLIKTNEEDTKRKIKEEEKISKGEEKSWIKENKKTAVLLSVLLIGVLLLPAAYAYRKNYAHKKSGATASGGKYSVTKTVALRMEAFTDEKNMPAGAVKSRIIKATVNDAMKYEDALKQAAKSAKEKTKLHEKIWKEPLNATNTDSLVFPLTFELMAYNENDISAQVSKEGQTRYGTGEFILSQLSIDKLEYAPLEKKRYFAINATYLVNPGIKDKKENASMPLGATSTPLASASSTDAAGASASSTGNADANFDVDFLSKLLNKANQSKYDNYVTVLSSKTGWINTRQGPGTKFPVLAKIFPNEIYELLAESKGWTKIRLADGQEAWVKDDYIKKTKKE